MDGWMDGCIVGEPLVYSSDSLPGCRGTLTSIPWQIISRAAENYIILGCGGSCSISDCLISPQNGLEKRTTTLKNRQHQLPNLCRTQSEFLYYDTVLVVTYTRGNVHVLTVGAAAPISRWEKVYWNCVSWDSAWYEKKGCDYSQELCYSLGSRYLFYMLGEKKKKKSLESSWHLRQKKYLLPI